MLVLRWLRSLARFVLGVVLIAPVVALPLAVLLDRGPAGETRLSPHVFPLVLWLFDDFAWTCAAQQLDFRDPRLAALARPGRRAGLGCRSPPVLGARDSLRAGDRLCWWCRRRFLHWDLGAFGVQPRPWPWPFFPVLIAEPRGSASSRGVVCRSGSCGSGRLSPGAWPW